MKNEGEEVLQVPDQNIPCSTWKGPQQSRLSSCSLCPVVEPTQEQMDIWPEVAWSPCRAHTGADTRPELQSMQRSLHTRRWPSRFCRPQGTHAGAVFLKDLTPWYGHILEHFLKTTVCGKIHIGSVCEGLHPIEGTPCWSRERVSLLLLHGQSVMDYPQHSYSILLWHTGRAQQHCTFLYALL